MSVHEARINNTAKYPNRREYGGALPVYIHQTLLSLLSWYVSPVLGYHP